MSVFALIAVSFGCISLLSFVAVPSAAAPARYRPESESEVLSDFPFEFSTKKGSKVTADNVLVQSVSSDGGTVFETNKPQPIKKYVSKSGKKQQNNAVNNVVADNAVNNAVDYVENDNNDRVYVGLDADEEDDIWKINRVQSPKPSKKYSYMDADEEDDIWKINQVQSPKPSKKYSYSAMPSGKKYVVYYHPVMRETSTSTVVPSVPSSVPSVPLSVPSVDEAPSTSDGSGQWNNIIGKLYKYLYPSTAGIRISFIN